MRTRLLRAPLIRPAAVISRYPFDCIHVKEPRDPLPPPPLPSPFLYRALGGSELFSSYAESYASFPFPSPIRLQINLVYRAETRLPKRTSA